MALLHAADPPDDAPLAQQRVEAGDATSPSSDDCPWLSITIPAVRTLSCPAPVPAMSQAPSLALPAPLPTQPDATSAVLPTQPAAGPPLPSSRRPMARQSSRVSLQDDQPSTSKQPKSKGKEKAVAPEPGPSGPPPSFAVTGFTPPTLDASTIKALTPMLAQAFADTNDALARVVKDTTTRQADLASQVAHMQAEHVALVLEIRDEMRVATATVQGSPDMPLQYAQALSDVVGGHNAVVDRVETLSDALAQIQASQTLLIDAVNRLGQGGVNQSTQPVSTTAGAAVRTVRPLKRAWPDEEWNAPIELDPSKLQYMPRAPLPVLASAPPPPPLPVAVHAPATVTRQPTVPATVLAPAPAPAPLSAHLPAASATHMPSAPPPMPAQSGVGPTPGLSVTLGPMKWARDITGQMRSLIAIMPRGQTVSRNIRATRAGTHYVYAIFQSIADAHHFVAMWNMERPATYENVEAHLN